MKYLIKVFLNDKLQGEFITDEDGVFDISSLNLLFDYVGDHKLRIEHPYCSVTKTISVTKSDNIVIDVSNVDGQATKNNVITGQIKFKAEGKPIKKILEFIINIDDEEFNSYTSSNGEYNLNFLNYKCADLKNLNFKVKYGKYESSKTVKVVN